jgi:GT2 family glycosyltransferase
VACLEAKAHFLIPMQAPLVHQPGFVALDELPDVSILVVNYNVKDYLRQCLTSIAKSTTRYKVQVVVVDNHSIDASVEELQPQFPWVTWLRLENNIGFGRGNNHGLAYCAGRYVLFLNPDTILGEDTISTMVEYLDANSEVGLAGCKVLNADGTFQLACRRGFPTPWASFCKLFGLQGLFPKSRLFARYNLTYLSEDETYPVDALIGAFMIGPRHLIESVGGFDPSYFMYGEDLDLCYRIQHLGYSIQYVHATSIIHFKGESTRRSSMNEVKEFYRAMETFARTHYGGSSIFLALLRLGIALRSIIELLVRRRREAATLVVDLVGVNVALMIATAIRFDSPFGFPPEAYPLVFIVVPGVVVVSLLSVGEYVEHVPGVRRTITGLFVAFFLLASLTYFFKEYGYSRGVVLMTIGLSMAWTMIVRLGWAAYDAWAGRKAIRKVVVVGLVDAGLWIADALERADQWNARVVGFISIGTIPGMAFHSRSVLGSTEYLEKVVREHDISEVILADDTMPHDEAMKLMSRCAKQNVRFHLASGYDQLVIARIIEDVIGAEPTMHTPPILRFRNRVAKRTFDLLGAFTALLFFAPVLFLSPRYRQSYIRPWFDVLKGQRSIVGLHPDGPKRDDGKMGLTSLAHVAASASLTSRTIEQLNDYYLNRYSFSMDVEILLHHLRLILRGNKHYS